MKKIDFKNLNLTKGLGIATAVAMGISALVGSLNDQKKEREFEEMKKALAELSKSKES